MDVYQKVQQKKFDKSLQNYFHEINKFPLLTPTEEIQLAKMIKQGDKQARSKLVSSNLRFVVSVAKDYRNASLQLGDLINEGNMGLIEAANRYDETKGFRFITYAVWWIKQSITMAITNHTRVVRIPANQQNNIRKITKARDSLTQKCSRTPFSLEIASSLGISEKEINKIYKLKKRSISLQSIIDKKNNSSLLDILENKNNEDLDKKLVKESFIYDVYNILKTLPSREAEIICMYYGILVDKPMKLEEISKKYNLTRERIRQIKETGLEKLRQMEKSDTLRDYFQ